MSHRLLADESVNFHIVRFLRSQDYEVVSIIENNPGISDKRVLDLTREFDAILLTEDSDFGEWIFAHKIIVKGVIFLRYKPENLKDIVRSLNLILEKNENLLHHFIVVTERKIRYREIP